MAFSARINQSRVRTLVETIGSANQKTNIGRQKAGNAVLELTSAINKSAQAVRVNAIKASAAPIVPTSGPATEVVIIGPDHLPPLTIQKPSRVNPAKIKSAIMGNPKASVSAASNGLTAGRAAPLLR